MLELQEETRQEQMNAIIIANIADTLRVRKGIDTTPSDLGYLMGSEREVLEEYFHQLNLPNRHRTWSCDSFDLGELGGSLSSVLTREELPMVVFDDGIYHHLRERLPDKEMYLLQVNRVLDDPHSGEMSLGARNGCIPLDFQIAILGQMLQGKEVVTVDNGAYYGGTELGIIERLKPYGIGVKKAYFAIATKQGFKILEEKIGPETDVIVSLGLWDEWLEHDTGDLIGIRKTPTRDGKPIQCYDLPGAMKNVNNPSVLREAGVYSHTYVNARVN